MKGNTDSPHTKCAFRFFISLLNGTKKKHFNSYNLLLSLMSPQTVFVSSPHEYTPETAFGLTEPTHFDNFDTLQLYAVTAIMQTRVVVKSIGRNLIIDFTQDETIIKVKKVGKRSSTFIFMFHIIFHSGSDTGDKPLR